MKLQLQSAKIPLQIRELSALEKLQLQTRFPSNLFEWSEFTQGVGRFAVRLVFLPFLSFPFFFAFVFFPRWIMLNIRENCTKLDTQNLQALNIPTSKVNVDFGISQLRVLIVRPFNGELYLCVIASELICFFPFLVVYGFSQLFFASLVVRNLNFLIINFY